MRPLLSGSTALFVALAGVGCSGADTTGPPGTGRVVFQLSTSPVAASGGPAAAADVTVALGTDVIVISRVQLVARKIKLERLNGTCPTPVVSEAESGESDTDSGDTPECPNLRLGPLLLDPPLATGAQTSFSLDLPFGTYHKLELQIHKPTGKSSDAAFLAANPGFAGVSIQVNGTFNGTPFVFTTDLTTEVEVEFATPVEVKTAGTTSLTLQLNVRGWFLNQGGAGLVSPLALSQQGRQRVEQNIRSSFSAFEDENHDGRRD